MAHGASDGPVRIGKELILVSRLLLVSNRLPITVRLQSGKLKASRSAGGLATGLRGPHERSGGLWIGWPGDVSGFDAAQREEMQHLLRDMSAVPIELSPGEMRGYYDNFSNGVLWPLFHYLVDRVDLDNWDFEAYRRVNECFADAVAQEFQEGDLIWVHDYHLALVPGMLRSRLPDARIGFFLHIPFPSSEVFRVLPWRQEILEGILGADLVGFHTLAYKRHFSSSLLVILGLETDVDRAPYGGRDVKLEAFPMGIDARRFDAIAAEPDVMKRARETRGDAGGRRILLGVDRLDYTKGIRRRLMAVEGLLRRQPELANRIRMIQVTVPSRGQVEAYGEYRRSVDEIVGRINSHFSTPDSVVIHYMYRGLDERELIAMYCAADAMLVTPVRDGMNLVAKEFIASRRDEDGVLLLSEFAGAASELGEALHLNPYDIDRTASTILRALDMPERERRARMRALRARVFERDIHSWAEDFIEALEMTHPGEPGRTVRPTAPEVMASLVQRVREYERVLLLLDYDGTLVSFADKPDQATPDGEIREILQGLASRSDTQVHVLSGRMRADLERWLGDLPIGLHAEHGFWSRLEPQNGWEAVREVAADWKRRIYSIIEQFVERTPGSWIEEKTASIAWHYRLADPHFANNQARELRYHLHEVLSNLPVEVLKGEKVVEVRLYGVHKGIAVQRIVADMRADGRFDDDGSVIVAMGDDRTDEDMFAALPPGSFAVQVGPKPSRARYRLQDVAAARNFLRCILKH